MRPSTLDDVLCPRAFENDLVRQPTALSHDEQIKSIAEMLMIHHGVCGRVRASERHLPARLSAEQNGHHCKSLPVVSGNFPVSFRAIALCVPELDVRLLGGEA